MKTITTTIKRQWLREIVAGTKKIEYREIKPYWVLRLPVEVPFALRLINGMQAQAPEVTVIIRKVIRNARLKSFELHIGSVKQVRNWDRRRQQPRRA